MESGRLFMLDQRLATFHSEPDVTRLNFFLFFCSLLISFCWKIDLSNIEGALISNENIFFHFNLIHRRENIQTSALGKNTRCLQSGQARWLGPDCYMLGLCWYLQMNCTANSNISHPLFRLNKRRFIILFSSKKKKKNPTCWIFFFHNTLFCSNQEQHQPIFLPAAHHCSLVHSTASELLHTTCPMLRCQNWILPSLAKRPEKTVREWSRIPTCCGFPNAQACAQDTCVCAWKWTWLTHKQGSQDVPECTKGVKNEAAKYASNGHEMKWFLRDFSRVLLFSHPFRPNWKKRRRKQHLPECHDVAGVDECDEMICVKTTTGN